MSLRWIFPVQVLMVYWQLSPRIQWSLFCDSNTSNHKKMVNHLVICTHLYTKYLVKKREMTRLEAKEDLNDNKREIGENGWIFIQKRCLFIDLKVTFRRNVFKIVDTSFEGLLWTHIFHNTSPLDWRDSPLFKEKLHFAKKKKLESPLTFIYLFLKGEIK